MFAGVASTPWMAPGGGGVPNTLGVAVVLELDPFCTAFFSALLAALLAEVECVVPFIGCFFELNALPWPACPSAFCTGGAAPPVCLVP
eukprot:8858350-Lingulodinium_polyedra.AAC.1